MKKDGATSGSCNENQGNGRLGHLIVPSCMPDSAVNPLQVRQRVVKYETTKTIPRFSALPLGSCVFFSWQFVSRLR